MGVGVHAKPRISRRLGRRALRDPELGREADDEGCMFSASFPLGNRRPSCTACSRVLAALLAAPACGVAAAPELAVDNPLVIADATGVVFNPCGGADAPAEHVRIDQLEVRLRDLQATTTCAPVATPSPWPQGRSIGVGAYGVSCPINKPRRPADGDPRRLEA